MITGRPSRIYNKTSGLRIGKFVGNIAVVSNAPIDLWKVAVSPSNIEDFTNGAEKIEYKDDVGN